MNQKGNPAGKLSRRDVSLFPWSVVQVYFETFVGKTN